MHPGATLQEPTKPQEPAKPAPAPAAYVPALDGLRAIAIFGVLVGHAGFTTLQGAAIHGVSVFFAVSGYLITELLVREFEQTGRVDLRAFYRRRFARLLPALIVALLAGAAYLLAIGAGFRSWIAGPVLALGYLTNVFVAYGWLGDGPAREMFEYTWSLSLEEQFYVVWPVLAAVLLRRPRGRAILAGVAVSVCVVSPLWRMALSASDPSFARIAWATDARLDAMLGGCLLALGLRVPAVRAVAARWASAALTGGGLVLAGLAWKGSVIFFDPGGFSAASAATCLVIAGLVLHREGRAATALAHPVIAHLGRLSYSIYLFNVLTLTVFVRVAGDEPAARWWGTPIWLLASVGVAQLSYRYVEVPLRDRWRSRAAT